MNIIALFRSVSVIIKKTSLVSLHCLNKCIHQSAGTRKPKQRLNDNNTSNFTLTSRDVIGQEMNRSGQHL